MAKDCRNCHLPMTEKNGSFQHVVATHNVTLHHVPYWACANCGHQFYDNTTQVEEKIIEAILTKQTDVNY